MSSAIPGPDRPGSVLHRPRSAPVAHISRSALVANAHLAARILPRAVYADDLWRADAWGHGTELVRDVLHEAGFAPAPTTARGGQAAGDPVIEATMLFGLPDSGGAPAMRLSGTVLSTKELRAGEGVSYGYTFRAPADTRVALVTGGYAQGIVRALGNRVSVVAGDARRPIVGRVAMDVCVIEIGDADVRRGDEVVFFGDPARDEPAVAEWMDAAGLTTPEIVAAVGLHAVRREAP